MSKFWSSNSDSEESSSSSSDNDNGSVDWDESESDQSNAGNNQQLDDPTAADPFEQQATKPDGESFSAKAALATTRDATNDPNIVWDKIRNDQVFLPPPTQKASDPKEDDCIRIVLMSDTHARHRDLCFLPKGDVLIHGGDFTKSGEIGTVEDLSQYFAEHSPRFDKIVSICGNHELTFQPEFYSTCQRKHQPTAFDPYACRAALQNCTYLEDSGTTLGSDDSIRVYGSPWTPAFYDWAFNLARGEPLDEVWSKIPSLTDVLITHGPPLGRGDYTDHSGRAGCHELLRHVQDRIRPRLHVFGHVHSGYGCAYDGHTLYANASNLDSDTEVCSKPCIVVDLPLDASRPARVVQPSCGVQTLGAFLEWLELEVRRDRYSKILSCSPKEDADLRKKVPFPEAFSQEDSFFELCGMLNLFRHKQGREELRKAVCELYAESFPRY